VAERHILLRDSRRSSRLPRVLAASLCILALGGVCLAEEPDPNALRPELGEAHLFFARLARGVDLMDPEAAQSGDPTEMRPAPEWAKSDPAELASLRRRPKVRTVDGLEKFDLDEIPRASNGLWRYPYYAFVGCPRDLLDGFFGGIGHVPILNLAFTGALYEVVPTQYLVRHRDDRHRWPGFHNQNYHGWIDAEKGWGFFSNLHNTEFTRVDTARLESRRLYNLRVDQKTALANQSVEQHNEEVDAKRQAYFEDTARLYASGEYREVIRRLLAYVRVDTGRREAKAMLAASLVAEMPSIHRKTWAGQILGNLMRTGSKQTLALMKQNIQAMGEQWPERIEPPLYLTWINLQMESYAQALEETERLLLLDIDNNLYQQLRFEVALASRYAPWIDTAVREVAVQSGADSVAARHARGRQAFVLNDYPLAREIYQDFVLSEPLNARFHYLLAMSDVREGVETGRCDLRRAMDHLRVAIELADTPGDATLYEKTLRAARLLDVEER
jgi:hypothetical protein